MAEEIIVKPNAFELLRKPFSQDEIEKLPKYAGKRDENNKIPKSAYGMCDECGKRHPLPAIHLDYVGHAGITDRLNDVDPKWNWEPVAFDENGLPQRDIYGGMWIKLTVLGITRYGYGDAQGKTGPNAVKETIGDAIRNAAMRFGVGTYLWSKSEKAEHMREFDEPDEEPKPDHRKPVYDRISALKEQVIANGVKPEGIASYYDTTFGKGTPLNSLTDSQLAELTEYLTQMVSDTKDGHLLGGASEG